jgi:hypothetical protein
LLIVGAGVSFLSKTKAGDKLPDGAALVDLLLDQPVGTGSKHPLDRVAGHVTRTKGVDHVYDLLVRTFTVEAVDDRLKKLYNLPWRRIYTTNYDNGIQTALKGKRPTSTITLDDDVDKIKAGSIVHLNGYIGHVSPQNIQANLVLTDYSYATSRLLESDWFKLFIRDLKSARSVFFVGYSLSDLDIERALIAEEYLARKCFFFISPQADEMEIGAIKEYGQLAPGGIDALLEEIDNTSSDYAAVRFSKGFLSLSEIRLAQDTSSRLTNAERLTEQLVYGRLPENEVLQGDKVFEDKNYLVQRQQEIEAIQAIRKGPWRDLLLIGELAAGKTASTLNLASYFLNEGYRVFYAAKGLTLSDELRSLAGFKEKIVVVFENYASMMSDIRDYVSLRQQVHRVILTERTVTHELLPDFIDGTKHLGPVFEASLDRIDPKDVPEFDALVNFGGFWGERAGASESARQRFISANLQGSLYSLLLEIIKSEKVQAEVRDLLRPIAADRRVMKLFVSSFIVNVLGFTFSINDWQAVFEAQWVRRVMRNYTEQVRHFLTIQGDSIFPRAGLLSAHILRTFADDEIVRECLVELYERAIRGEADPEFFSLRIALTRYGSIEPIFSDRKKAENIFRYYDDIRVYGSTRNNPDYWLQVGIAATIHDDLSRAKPAFENAYARERAKTRPNLKKIDNYFSRFEMRMAIEESDSTEAFASFLRANERLKKQIFLEENRHYPFKTGRYYTDIAAKHYDKWNEAQQLQFVREAKDIRDRANDWKSARREFSADVEILIRETTTLLSRIEKEQDEQN